MCSWMFVLCGSVSYAPVNILLIIQTAIHSLSSSLSFYCLPSWCRDIHLRLRSMCHFLSLQQWEGVGVGWGDLVADTSVFLILLLSCGLISSLGMYSYGYKIVLTDIACVMECVAQRSIQLNCRLFRPWGIDQVHVCRADILLCLRFFFFFFFTGPKTVFNLNVIGLCESSMTDSYQRRWMQSASSEPGPLGLPALLRTLPCALSWNTKNNNKCTYYTLERHSLT